MRTTGLIFCCMLLAACGSSGASENSTASSSVDPERRAIAQRADNPDFSAVDALANKSTSTGDDLSATASRPATERLPDVVPVVTDPVAAMKAAIAVSARGDDGIRTLPLAPDLLIAFRRHDQPECHRRQ